MARRSIDAYREMLDLAANVGASILGCHGRVGRVCALTMRVEEVALLTDSGRRVAEHAATLGIRVAFEVLNRYETHLVCHVEGALGLVLDTYHMNIEEEDPIKSVEAGLGWHDPPSRGGFESQGTRTRACTVSTVAWCGSAARIPTTVDRGVYAAGSKSVRRQLEEL